jgi:gentisate 1,2-dioxygenase
MKWFCVLLLFVAGCATTMAGVTDDPGVILQSYEDAPIVAQTPAKSLQDALDEATADQTQSSCSPADECPNGLCPLMRTKEKQQAPLTHYSQSSTVLHSRYRSFSEVSSRSRYCGGSHRHKHAGKHVRRGCRGR